MKRVHYFTGQILTAADLQAEQDYFRKRAQRHNRLLHGWGVVDGLQVSISGGSVLVAPGMALDGLGREVAVERARSRLLPRSGRTLYVCIRYAERGSDPVPALGADGESGTAFTRIVEGCETVLESRDPCALRGKRERAPEKPVPLAITLARLRRTRGAWSVDRRFRPRRVR